MTIHSLLSLLLAALLTSSALAQNLSDVDPCDGLVIAIDLRIGPDGLGQLGFPDLVDGAYQFKWHYTGIAPAVMKQIRELMAGSSLITCDVMAQIVNLLRDTPEPGPAEPNLAGGQDWGKDRNGDPLKGPPFKWGEDRNGRPYKGPNGFNGYGVDPAWAVANGIPGATAVTPSGYRTPDKEWISYYDMAGEMAYYQSQADAYMALYVTTWNEVQVNEGAWAALNVVSALGGIAKGVTKIGQAGISRAAQVFGKSEAQVAAGTTLGSSFLCKAAGPDGLLRSFWDECVIGEMIGGKTATTCMNELAHDVDHWNGEVARMSREINSVPDPGEVWRILNGGLYK